MPTGGSGSGDGARRRGGGDQLIPRPQRWRPGPPAPWAPERLAPSVADIVGRIAGRMGSMAARWPADRAPATGSPSAVLVALAEGAAGAEVLLTRRSWELRHHGGEVSFPGGRIEDGESPAEAAVREAFEEVGLDPSLVTVHGELDHLATFASASIVPVVASLGSRPDLHPATGEVDRVLWVPLVELARADTFREEWWDRGESEWQVFFFELDDETIWGATARVLHQLLHVAAGDPPA